MAKERGLFRIIFSEFLKSITPTFRRRILVGEDYMGTKYYEVTKDETSIRKKPNRFFEPKNKDDFEQEIPAEWEAWLRNRRKLPPTEAEVMANYEMILLKRKNAAELEITYAKKVDALELVDPNAKPLTQHASAAFPSYDEYKHHGQHYKVNIKK